MKETTRVHVERRLVDYPPPTPQPTPCRLWQGYCNEDGYGVKTIGHSHFIYMHRWVWEQINGQIPPGMHVLHRCDNPPCYRYDHLWLGTNADNIADAIAKGRHRGQPRGERNTNAKLTEDQVRIIRKRLAAGETTRSVAESLGVSKGAIKHIKQNRNWKWLS